jgi:hypothetical protein
MQILEVPGWRAAMLITSVLLVAGFIAASGSNEQHDRLAEADESAIRATIAAYRTAWLANDAKGALRTFTDEAVLLPAHGAPAVAGIVAIEKYWFAAGGPPTTLTELNISVDRVSGNHTGVRAGVGQRSLDCHSGGHYTPPLPSRNLPQRDEETARRLLANPGAHAGRRSGERGMRASVRQSR